MANLGRHLRTILPSVLMVIAALPTFAAAAHADVGGPCGNGGQTPGSRQDGYWAVDASGGVFTFGCAPFYGSAAGKNLAAPIVGLAGMLGWNGYWLAGADGGVFTFGDAAFYGSMGGQRLNSPIVGIVSQSSGGGYTLAAADGGVFTFGQDRFFGSMATQRLTAPVVAIAAAAYGNGSGMNAGFFGYWMLGSDGAVYSFGAAKYYGRLTVDAGTARALLASPDGNGYWVITTDGISHPFGDAQAFGGPSQGTVQPTKIDTGEPDALPPTCSSGVITPAHARGLWLGDAAGDVADVGSAPDYGSPASSHPAAPIVGIASAAFTSQSLAGCEVTGAAAISGQR